MNRDYFIFFRGGCIDGSVRRTKRLPSLPARIAALGPDETRVIISERDFGPTGDRKVRYDWYELTAIEPSDAAFLYLDFYATAS